MGQGTARLGQRLAADGRDVVDALTSKLPPPRGGLQLAPEGVPAGGGQPAALRPDPAPPKAPQVLNMERRRASDRLPGSRLSPEIEFETLGSPTFIHASRAADRVFALFEKQAITVAKTVAEGDRRIGQLHRKANSLRHFGELYEGELQILRPVLRRVADGFPVDVVVNHRDILAGTIGTGVQVAPLPFAPGGYHPIRAHYGSGVFDRSADGLVIDYRESALRGFQNLVAWLDEPPTTRPLLFRTSTRRTLALSIMDTVVPRRAAILDAVPAHLHGDAAAIIDEMKKWAQEDGAVIGH